MESADNSYLGLLKSSPSWKGDSMQKKTQRWKACRLFWLGTCNSGKLSYLWEKTLLRTTSLLAGHLLQRKIKLSVGKNAFAQVVFAGWAPAIARNKVICGKKALLHTSPFLAIGNCIQRKIWLQYLYQETPEQMSSFLAQHLNQRKVRLQRTSSSLPSCLNEAQ